MARLEAIAGAEQIAAVWDALTHAARQAKKSGDSRGMDQLRLDELISRVVGWSRSAAPSEAPPAPPASSETQASPEPPVPAAFTAPAPPSGWSPTVLPGVGLSIGLTLPLATFLQLRDDPAVLDGYGPIAAALARQIAADAARANPRAVTWRCMIVDDVHGTVLGTGQPIRTPRHDPPPRLVELVRRVHPTCVFPGCNVPASRCDLDHRIPYRPDEPERSGPTCECNMQPLCRTHHRLKTTGLISCRVVEQQPRPHGQPLPPALEWTTRGGLRYRSTPDQATPRGISDELAAAMAFVREQDRENDRLVAWTNEAVRGAYTRGRLEASAELVDDLEEELRSEVRHHDYGLVAARNVRDPAEYEPPEPDVTPPEPRWMRRVIWGDPPDEHEPEPEAA
jgi:hypothetical protein